LPRKKKNPAAFDEAEAAITSLRGGLPAPRQNLTEAEKDDLVQKIGGPRTASDIVAAKKAFTVSRIPFLFSSLDTQAVVDILHNDMKAAIARALQRTPA